MADYPVAPQTIAAPVDSIAVAEEDDPDETVKIGDPYEVDGKSYVPQQVSEYDEVGYASWYGEDFEGKPTANGEIFSEALVSGAHKTLPLPTYVEVTALKTGRTILVRVNDRGPFTNERLIDLSRAAADQLGMTHGGIAPVRVRMVDATAKDKSALRQGTALPTRDIVPSEALEPLRIKLAEADARKVAIAATDIPPSSAYKPDQLKVAPPATARLSEAAPAPSHSVRRGTLLVQVGAFASRENADATATKSGGQVYSSGKLFRVRTGPYANAAQANKGVAHARANGYPDARIVRAD